MVLFSLSVPAGANTLVISSVGYGTQEINVANQTAVDVLLQSTGANLNECGCDLVMVRPDGKI
jgi:hypothetical protein